MTRKIDDYWLFNTEKFIRDYPDNKKELCELQSTLEEITETKSFNYDAPPGTPGRGDSVPSTVEQKDSMQKKIQNIGELVSLYEIAEKQLTDEERMIIRYCFHEPGLLSSNIQFLGKKLHYERTAVYTRRRETIDKFSKILHVNAIRGK